MVDFFNDEVKLIKFINFDEVVVCGVVVWLGILCGYKVFVDYFVVDVVFMFLGLEIVGGVMYVMFLWNFIILKSCE